MLCYGLFTTYVFPVGFIWLPIFHLSIDKRSKKNEIYNIVKISMTANCMGKKSKKKKKEQ